MKDFTKLLHGWSVLCRVLLPAAIGLAVLSAVSCRTQRVEERIAFHTDSLQAASTESVTVETVMQGVAGDSVSLAIPMEVIQILPEGAEFSRKEGRTRVSLRRQGYVVIAEAVTDSVPREGRRYERRARDSLRQRGETALHSTSNEERPTVARRVRLIGLAVLTIVAVLLSIKIRTLFK